MVFVLKASQSGLTARPRNTRAHAPIDARPKLMSAEASPTYEIVVLIKSGCTNVKTDLHSRGGTADRSESRLARKHALRRLCRAR